MGNGRNNKKGLYITLVLLIALIIGIGYAYLASNLSINGSTKMAANSWDIHFENIQITEGSVTIETGESAAAVNPSNNTEVTYSIKLNRPGDFYEFTVDVKNYGTIDGMVDTITSTLQIDEATPIIIADDKSNLPVYLDYNVTYSDDLKIESNHELKAGEKETYKVRIEFKKDINNDALPTNNMTLRFSTRATFVQSNENAVTMSHTPPATVIYVVSSTIMNIGQPIPSILQPTGVAVRNNPNDAMADWELLIGKPGNTRTFYLKHIIINNQIVESYVEFVVTPEMAQNNPEMTAGTYSLRGGINEESLTNRPIYTANESILTTAYNSSKCSPHESGLCCYSSGLEVCAYGDGIVVAYGGGSFDYCSVGSNGSSDCSY